MLCFPKSFLITPMLCNHFGICTSETICLRDCLKQAVYSILLSLFGHLTLKNLVCGEKFSDCLVQHIFEAFRLQLHLEETD